MYRIKSKYFTETNLQKKNLIQIKTCKLTQLMCTYLVPFYIYYFIVLLFFEDLLGDVVLIVLIHYNMRCGFRVPFVIHNQCLKEQ